MKKYKIAIIAHGCRTGGGLFGTLNLLRALSSVAQNEQFLLICSEAYGYEEIELPADSELFIYRGQHSPFERTWFERVTLPKVVARYNPDVILGAANIGLTKPCAPQALYIRMPYLLYDRNHYPDIDWRWQLRIAALKSQVKKSLQGTGLIFAQTPIVKRRFSERFDYPQDQINVLRLPPPAEIRPTTKLEIPSVFDESSDSFYILLLTPYMLHRNPSALITLCKRYAGEIRSKQIKFITTVEVEDHPHAGRFLKEVSKHRLEDVIINVGRLSREDVARYLSHTHLLWLPTTLETLGLPFLEAMAVGVPILAPDLDFARYVCGEAALFYNPWDVESMFSKITVLGEDAPLREHLVESGKAQLADRAKFAESWEEVAANMIRDLRLLVKRN
jgi:glycosyltransferase involved in cell wall biosynthesis